MNSKAKTRFNLSKPTVILLYRDNVFGWNLRLMLQVAGCQVCCVSNLAEGLNIAHTARETGEMVVCFVGRAQQLSVEEVERFLAYVEENGLSLPLVVLKPHAGYVEEMERLRHYCGVRLWCCSPVELVETIQPFMVMRKNPVIGARYERRRIL